MNIVRTPISPNSECWLINVPWDSTYNDVYTPHGTTHALRRSTAATYFEGLKTAGLHITDLKPNRRSWAFKIHAKYYEVVNKYNYCILADNDPRFKDDENKVVYQYCFIADVAYVTDDIIEVSIVTDYWTQFYTMAKDETTFKGMQFINRMHVCDDTPLKWKAEESYIPYQYIQTNEQYLGYWDNTAQGHHNFGADRNIPVIFTTGELASGVPEAASITIEGEQFPLYNYFDGGFRGSTKNVGKIIICANITNWIATGGTLYSCNAEQVNAIVECYSGNPSQIIAIKAIPFDVIVKWATDTSDWGKEGYIGGNADTGITLTMTPLMNNIFDGYVPRNNKLFNDLSVTVTNNNGGVNEFRIMDFYDIENAGNSTGYPYDFKFKVFSDVSPNADCVLYPCNYQHKPYLTGDSVNLNYPLSLGLCGSLPWVNDSYKMWLAQQGGEDTLRAIQANANSTIDNGTLQSIAGISQQIAQSDVQMNTAEQQYNYTTAGMIDNAQKDSKIVNSVVSGLRGIVGALGSKTLNTALEGTLGGSTRAGMEGQRQSYTLSKQYSNDVIGYIKQSSNLQKEAVDLQYNAMFKGAKSLPDIYNATTSSTVEAFNGKGFFAYIMAMSKYDARHLDNYLDMYGYAINEYTPNMNIYTKNPIFSRDVFNYVRLTDCHLNKVANGTESETRVLEEIFNNGVRVWHNVVDLESRNTLVANGVKSGHSDNILGVDT